MHGKLRPYGYAVLAAFSVSFASCNRVPVSFSAFPVGLSAVQPPSGTQETLVTLTGVWFSAYDQVALDGKPCIATTVLSPTSLLCKVPDHGLGAVDVSITDTRNGNQAVLPKAFTYVDALSLTSVSPNSAPAGTTINLEGKGFGQGATIILGDLPCLEIHYVNANSLTCVTPPHEDGPVDVHVINPGLESVVLKEGYTYHEGTTSVAIRLIQPALAVRGISCVMCHASIVGNVITDLGYGDPWYISPYINQKNSLSEVEGDPSWTNPFYANSFASARQIVGSLYLPDKPVPLQLARVFKAATGQSFDPATLTLPQFFQIAYPATWIDYLTPEQRNQSLSFNIRPEPSGSPKIVAVSEISIRAPQASDILNIAPDLVTKPDQVAFTEVRAHNSKLPKLSGLTVSGSNHQFVTNQGSPVEGTLKGSLSCYSDVVINGPLYLKEALLETSDAGCRLYVNGPVFLEGPITYTKGGVSNLQITSSQAIVMGMNLANVQSRFSSDEREVALRNMDWGSLASLVVSAASVINPRDAADFSGTNYATASGANGQIRASIDYQHLFLNAPVIESRYLGKVTGSIVAEVALFSLGAFVFQFDPVFNTTSVLPLLKLDPLEIKK